MKGMLGIIGIGTLALLAMVGWPLVIFLLADVWPVLANISGLTGFVTFFGGVAGPILGLLTFFGVILTLALQGAQLKLLQDAHIADQHIRALNTLLDDLQALEQQHYAPGQTLEYALAYPNEHIGDKNYPSGEALPRGARPLCKPSGHVSRKCLPYWDCQAFALREAPVEAHTSPG